LFFYSKENTFFKTRVSTFCIFARTSSCEIYPKLSNKAPATMVPEWCQHVTLAQIRDSPAYRSSRLPGKARMSKRSLCQHLRTSSVPVPSQLLKDHGKLEGRVRRKYGGKRALQIVPEGWAFAQLIGEGGSGEAYLISNGLQERVIKYQNESNEDVLYEILMQEKFASHGLSLRVQQFDTWGTRQDPHSAILMEKIDTVLTDFLRQRRESETLDNVARGLINIVHKMCRLKIRHNDFHWQNVGLMYDLRHHRVLMRPIVFDFGYASEQHRSCHNSVELFQLARTMSPEFNPKINRANMRYLSKVLFRAFAEQARRDGINLPAWVRTVQDLDDDDLFDKFVTRFRPSRTYKREYVRQHRHTLNKLRIL
jgi:hypothetical protein